MRKILPVLFFSLILFSNSCLKSHVCEPKTAEEEQDLILNFAASNGIYGTLHSSGIYYQVTNPGTGATPTANSKVSVRYTGKLLNGTVFDSQTGTPLTFTLNAHLPGWQIGLPLIQKGGTIKLIIPSSLAYGCVGVDHIPSNSVLYFDIELVDVQ